MKKWFNSWILEPIYIWFLDVFGYCRFHGHPHRPRKYRRNTAYVDDTMNWGFGCPLCEKEDYDDMQELWDEYNSSRF